MGVDLYVFPRLRIPLCLARSGFIDALQLPPPLLFFRRQLHPYGGK